MLQNNIFSMTLTLKCLFQPAKEVDPGQRESVLQFEDKDQLPLRDVAVFANSSLSQEFGFTVGPVCFS